MGIAQSRRLFEWNDKVTKYWPKFPTKAQNYIIKGENIGYIDIEPKQLAIADIYTFGIEVVPGFAAGIYADVALNLQLPGVSG